MGSVYAHFRKTAEKTDEEKKFRRQLEDYIRKHCGINELRAIAELLGIKGE